MRVLASPLPTNPSNSSRRGSIEYPRVDDPPSRSPRKLHSFSAQWRAHRRCGLCCGVGGDPEIAGKPSLSSLRRLFPSLVEFVACRCGHAVVQGLDSGPGCAERTEGGAPRTRSVRLDDLTFYLPTPGCAFCIASGATIEVENCLSVNNVAASRCLPVSAAPLRRCGRTHDMHCWTAFSGIRN